MAISLSIDSMHSEASTSGEAAMASSRNLLAALEGEGAELREKDRGGSGDGPGKDNANFRIHARSQLDADMALARALQEQERRAYLLLHEPRSTSVIQEPSEHSWHALSRESSGDFSDPYLDEEDDNHDQVEAYGRSTVGEERELIAEQREPLQRLRDMSVEEMSSGGSTVNSENDCSIGERANESTYVDDEAFARALQEAEDREMTAHLMALAGLGNGHPRTEQAGGNDPEDDEEWTDELDGDASDGELDNLSYEDWVAIGEAVGTESRGLSMDAIAHLPQMTYSTAGSKTPVDLDEECVICRVEFEEGDQLVSLPCKHLYHAECISRWLYINKVCPICTAEVVLPASKAYQQ